MKKSKKPPKAYRNIDFLNSPDARTIRILSEYYEPLARFKKYGIRNLIVFFGSARAKSSENIGQQLNSGSENSKPENNQYVHRLSEYYQDAVTLSQKLTEWSMDNEDGKQEYYICSGGGPGMMEAANRGASLAGGKSVGLNISIPMEQNPNPYITKELMFEFHYFFIRKFWFIYLAKALVIFPGGFGTFDELMEALTLLQTKKTLKELPIIIYGKDYWNEVIDFEAMIRWSTISKEDLDLIYFCDKVEDAFTYLTGRLARRIQK